MPTIIDHVSKEKIYDMGCHLHLFRKYTTVAHRSGAFGKFTEAEGKKQKAKRVVNFTPQDASQSLLLRLLM